VFLAVRQVTTPAKTASYVPMRDCCGRSWSRTSSKRASRKNHRRDAQGSLSPHLSSAIRGREGKQERVVSYVGEQTVPSDAGFASLCVQLAYKRDAARRPCGNWPLHLAPMENASSGRIARGPILAPVFDG
jgi:hypothetical protein